MAPMHAGIYPAPICQATMLALHNARQLDRPGQPFNHAHKWKAFHKGPSSLHWSHGLCPGALRRDCCTHTQYHRVNASCSHGSIHMAMRMISAYTA